MIVSKPEYHDLVAAAPDDRWIKSSLSDNSGPYCVEIADVGDGVIAVRDSTHPEGPVLAYTKSEIAAFIAGAKAGEFDHLI
jgi:hypothetical protein